MAGGEGVDVYFGYGGGTCDICNEDYHNRHSMWKQLAHGIRFFQNPAVNRQLRTMRNCNELSSGLVLADPGQMYVIYATQVIRANLMFVGLIRYREENFKSDPWRWSKAAARSIWEFRPRREMNG